MGVKLVASSGGSVELVPTNTASNFTVTVPAVTASMLTDSSGVMNIGSGQIYKDASGNVGIGVTPSAWNSATKPIQLGTQGAYITGITSSWSAGGYTYIGNNGYYDTSWKYSISQSAAQYTQAGDQHIWSSVGAGTAGASITFVERMRIDSSGNVAINNTSPSGSKLDVYGDPSSALLRLQSTAASDSANRALNIIKYANDSTTAQVFVTFAINQGATGSGKINANGASAAAFGSFSDARLKENIEPLPNQLDSIMALKPCEFDYKDGSGHQIGFIAQEMQEVYPDVVAAGDDEMLMITGWSKTEARLVKAIQEQQAIITSLTDRITLLESK